MKGVIQMLPNTNNLSEEQQIALQNTPTYITDPYTGNQVPTGGGAPVTAGTQESLSQQGLDIIIANQQGQSNIKEPEIIQNIKDTIDLSAYTPVKPITPVKQNTPVVSNGIKTSSNLPKISGTTPNTPIIITKPTPNYLVYGLFLLAGGYVVYKFFIEKSE